MVRLALSFPALFRAIENARLVAGVFVLSFLLGGCALLAPQTSELRKARPGGLPERIELEQVPFVAQEDFHCGPSALAMSIGSVREGITLDELVAQVYLPGRQGSLQVEMLAAPRRHGLVSYPLEPRFETLLREIAAGQPVIVLMDFGVWPVPVWHYAVAVGYDLGKRQIVLRSGRKPRSPMPFALFEYLWRESGYWSMVIMPPEKLPATASEEPYLAAIAALDRAGQRRPALAAYRRFLVRWPGNAKALFAQANALHAEGELEPALAALREAHARDPGSVPVLNNLAQTLSDLGHQREALGFAEQAQALGGPFAAEVSKTRDGIAAKLKGPMRPGHCPR